MATAEAIFEYAEDRFENNDYETAIFEFKRFVYFFPGKPQAAQASCRIGICYFRLAKYETALEYFKKTRSAYPDTEFALEAKFRISDCHVRMNAPASAEAALLNIIKASEDGSIRDRAFYKLAWLCLETGRIGQASTWLDRMSQSGQNIYLVGELKKDMDRMTTLPHKNPLLAGVFSIVPGGGYLYTNRYQDATVALLVNSALMGAAYESFDNDLEVLGSLISVVGLGFYAGSMYGAISSAHKFNRAAYNDFIEGLEKDQPDWDFSVVPHNAGVLFSFSCRF